MSDPLVAAGRVASTGLSAQSTRLRIIAENMANANSTGATTGAAPYQRKIVALKPRLTLTQMRKALKLQELVGIKHPTL